MSGRPLLVGTQLINATSKTIKVTADVRQPTVMAKNLGAAETLKLQVSDDGGTTFFDVYESGALVQLTQTANIYSIRGTGTYRAEAETAIASSSFQLSIATANYG